MWLRKGLGLAAAALLGAAVVILPAAASSETVPTIAAENVSASVHYWRPPEATIEAGGSVQFANPTAVPHGIQWVSTPGGAPECTPGVPVGSSASASGTNWSGSCRFTKPGTYTFYCTVHGPAMSGTITVGAASTTTGGTATSSTAITGTTPVYSQPGSTVTSTTATPLVQGTGGSVHADGALTGLRLAALRHDADVRVSVVAPAAEAGGTLGAAILARIAGRNVAVGREVRTHVGSGPVSLTVPLSRAARRALRLRGQLALTVRVTLLGASGAPLTLTRTVTLRAARSPHG